jgi:hypothetical protein
MHKTRIAIIVILLTLLLPSTLHVSAQDELRCSEDESISYLWQVQDEDCVFEQQISFSISIAFPTEITNYSFARQTIDEYFNERRAEFWSFANDMDFTFGFLNPWSLDISYTVFQHSDRFLSLQFAESVYTGGAHPNLLFHTFSFDLETEQVVSLGDIFVPDSTPLETIQPIIQFNLELQMTEMFGSITDLERDWIMDGTGDDLNNYRNFALTDDAVVFFFEPYQVAAYAAGPFTVEIPFTDLAGLLSDDLIVSQ